MGLIENIINKVNGITPDTIAKENDIANRNESIANFLAERLKDDKIKSVVFDLVEQTKYLTKQDVGKWRKAWQRAISVEWPSRVDLHATYRDVAIDNHIMAIKGQIKKEVLQKELLAVDRKDKKTNYPDLVNEIEDAKWFINYCGYVIDAAFGGLELVQFGDVVTENGIKKFASCEAIDQDHLVPEHDVFVKNIGDSWKNGFDYTKPPYNAWVIPVGEKKDLGLYNTLAPHAIAKKNMLAFWDKFGEIFGMPIRIGKTSSSNPNDRNMILEMLQKMGAAAYGLFPEGTGIEIKETTRGDAWMVYDKRVERANSEMSKAILHQTMTTDNGSSRSQGEVHLEIQEKVIEYFARLVRISVNDQLIPFMIRHGFTGWENVKVRFDDTVEYTVDEQVKILELLLEHYDVDQTQVSETFNWKINGKKEPAKNNPSNFFD